MSLYRLAQPALFCLDAERAHELTIETMKRAPRLFGRMFAAEVPADPVELFGLRFPNRIGLAAGLDKNADCVDALGALGFGFIEVGTLTPRPQPGNPRPRMFRLPAHGALINRLGFNNKGIDHAVRRLRERRFRGIVGVNIGKNADTPIERALDDYRIGLEKAWPVADYITVNISSPNTADLRQLQHGDELSALLAALHQSRVRLSDAHGQRRPLLLKVAPDLDEAQIDALSAALIEHGVDGLIATNTTITRPGLDDEPLAGEAGGLSGAPLREASERVLTRFRSRLGPSFPIIGVGGIDSGEAARARRNAGADLLQVYTGFIYRGPSLLADAGRTMLPCSMPIR